MFFANKMDIAGALTPQEVAEQLDLAEVCTDRPHNIIASNALTGQGIEEGMNWLSSCILKDERR